MTVNNLDASAAARALVGSLQDDGDQPRGLSAGAAPVEQAVNTNEVSAIRSADKGGE